jgi:hypothetical protein
VVGLLFLAIAALGFALQWRTTQAYVGEEYAAENPFTTAGTGTTDEAAPAAGAAVAEATPGEAATGSPAAVPASALASSNGAPPAADLPAASA